MLLVPSVFGLLFITPLILCLFGLITIKTTLFSPAVPSQVLAHSSWLRGKSEGLRFIPIDYRGGRDGSTSVLDEEVKP
jgi:hypothetical protein